MGVFWQKKREDRIREYTLIKKWAFLRIALDAEVVSLLPEPDKTDSSPPQPANIKVNIHLTNYSLETDLSDEIVTVEGKVVWVTQKQKQTVKMGMEFIKPNATLLKYYMKNAAEL